MFPDRNAQTDSQGVRRRAFQPGKIREPRRRRGGWPPADWRERVPPAFLRAIIAVGFLVSPAFEDRFGDGAFPLTSVALGVFAALGAMAFSRSEARNAWPPMATDALVCAILAPVIAVAGRLQVAAPELGGSTRGFSAAAAALVATFTLITIFAAIVSTRQSRPGGLELLTGSMMVAVAMLGAERFATQELTAGLSLAAMVAALVTVLDGLMPVGYRPALPPVAFIIIAITTVGIARGGEAGTVTDSKALIALLVSAIAGGALLVIPAVAARLATNNSSPPRASR